MDEDGARVALLDQWLSAAGSVAKALRGLSESDLYLRSAPGGWSIGENMHHLVESYLASTAIIIAAVGSDDPTDDCSWMTVDHPRLELMGCSRLPIVTDVEVIIALSRYVAALLDAAPHVLRREVKYSPLQPRSHT